MGGKSLTKAHTYKESKGRFYIDGTRVKPSRFKDSKTRSERIRKQFRYANGTIGAIVVSPAKELQREIREEAKAPEVKRKYLIRGIARPRSNSDARTPELESDHVVEVSERVDNLTIQENMLNQKYPSWVHFDTFLEEVSP